MSDKGKQRPVLFKYRLPVIAVKVRIIEILALDPPGLAINLFPLGSRIDTHFELGDVEWSISHLSRNGTIGRHDSPTGSAAGAGLIQKFLLVIGQRVRTNAF